MCRYITRLHFKSCLKLEFVSPNYMYHRRRALRETYRLHMNIDLEVYHRGGYSLDESRRLESSEI
jgi:hypothetical protein